MLTKTTCPPLELPIFSPYLGRQYDECEQWRQQMLARIQPPFDVPTCLSSNLSHAQACTFGRAGTVNDAGIVAEPAGTLDAGGIYLPLIPLFCTSTRCPVIVGTTSSTATTTT